MRWPQPTAQYGQTDWTTRSAVLVRGSSSSERFERAARPSASGSPRSCSKSGSLRTGRIKANAWYPGAGAVMPTTNAQLFPASVDEPDGEPMVPRSDDHPLMPEDRRVAGLTSGALYLLGSLLAPLILVMPGVPTA